MPNRGRVGARLNDPGRATLRPSRRAGNDRAPAGAGDTTVVNEDVILLYKLLVVYVN